MYGLKFLIENELSRLRYYSLNKHKLITYLIIKWLIQEECLKAFCFNGKANE